MTLKQILRGLLIRSSRLFNDELYLKLLFRIEMGKYLNLSNCMTMNQKLQWLKLNNRHSDLTDIVDKISVKNIIKEKLGIKYVVPTLKIWDDISDITQEDITLLPQKFVMKTNHSGGNTGVIVCKDKSKFNISSAKNKMSQSLQSDIYKKYREWPYKDIKKRIFTEEYLGDNLVDYKFFCFNGYVDCVMVCLDREIGDAKFYFFDREWNLKRFNVRGKNAPKNFTIPKPIGMDEMFHIASKLSQGFPFVRVDLYNINGKIYFGEMTFFPASGFDSNLLPETDMYFGSLIDLSLAKNN